MATYSKTYRATAAPSVGNYWTDVENIYDNDVDSYAYRASGSTSATHINGFGIDLPNDAVFTSLEIHSKVYAYSYNGTNGYICIYLLSDLATSDSTKRINVTEVVNGASFSAKYVTQTYTADELTAILNSIGLHNGNPIEFLKNLRVRFVIGSTSSSTSTHCRVYDNYVVVNYKIPGYIITVNAGTGGTVSGGGEYDNGTTATLTATPSTGYKFKQWSDGDTNATRTITVTANATYTAQFTPVYVTYDSIFNFQKWKSNGISASNGIISDENDIGFVLVSNDGANEGTATSPFFEVEYGKSYKIDIDVVGDDWDVYIFFCDENGTWIDFADSTNRFSSNGGGVSSRIFTAPNNPEVVKAQIRCDANGANNTVVFGNFRIYPSDCEYMSNTVSSNERTDTAAWSMPTPTRAGYTFTGWNTKADGSGTMYTSASAFPSDDLTLYSQWESSSSIFVGTQRVTVYCGRQKMSVYCGTQKLS